MASYLLSSAGWYFLPNFVTGYVQSALYSIFIRAGDPKPAPGSPRFVRDRRRIQICVIVAYLLYTIYEADHILLKDGDFYRNLGVPHDVDEKSIQSKFRRLTVQYHPDKAVGPNKDTINAIYVQLKLARDTLVDPAKRFAYDRFGSDMIGWQRCTTTRDFIMAGLQNVAAYYIGSAGLLVLLGVVGYLRTGNFWRYLVLAALFAFELHVASRPTFPAALTRIFNPLISMTGWRPPYLPFQMIVLLRKMALTFFIALVQLAPLLRDPHQALAEQHGGDAVSPQVLDRVDKLTQTADEELARLRSMELMPFAGDEAGARELKGSLKEWLVQNAVRNDPEVKSAIGRALDRRRREGESNNGVRSESR